jgi:hypothetical protein
MELRKLAGIANKLDSLGLTKEADVLDRYIRKIAGLVSNSLGDFAQKVTISMKKKTKEEMRNITSKILLIRQSDFDATATHANIPVLNLYIAYYLLNPTLPFSETMYSDTTEQSRLEAEINKQRGVRVGTGGGSGAGAGGGTKTPGQRPAPGAGGVDAWARYIATAKDPKTGKVNTDLNTRVKQVWQTTNPAQKEFSEFTSWYSKQKGNMSGLGLTAKDFGQEQAIALIQTTGGSGKGWEGSNAALASIYKNIVISQSPASFDPSSVGLGRSGAGYAADFKGYKPTEGRSSDPAKALLRSQMAGPAEQEYAGTATTFKDNDEFFEYDPEVKRQMAARRSQNTQGVQAAPPSGELNYKTERLISS